MYGMNQLFRLVLVVIPILTCKKKFFSSGYHFVKIKKNFGQHKFHLAIHQPKLKKKTKKNYFSKRTT